MLKTIGSTVLRSVDSTRSLALLALLIALIAVVDPVAAEAGTEACSWWQPWCVE